jgi:hypothetical protein
MIGSVANSAMHTAGIIPAQKTNIRRLPNRRISTMPSSKNGEPAQIEKFSSPDRKIQKSQVQIVCSQRQAVQLQRSGQQAACTDGMQHRRKDRRTDRPPAMRRANHESPGFCLSCYMVHNMSHIVTKTAIETKSKICKMLFYYIYFT